MIEGPTRHFVAEELQLDFDAPPVGCIRSTLIALAGFVLTIASGMSFHPVAAAVLGIR